MTYSSLLPAAGVFFLACCAASPVRAAGPFIEQKGVHFVVQTLTPEQRGDAGAVLARAEEAYEQAARTIGFVRHDNFWTWERRVKVVLFPDAVSYARFTGQQGWSKGYASRDSALFSDRVIVTFSGQPDMAATVIPHEVAHLMLWDLLGANVRLAPVWFEEGVAQLMEAGARDAVGAAMRPVVASGQQIPFSVFESLDPGALNDPVRVSLFYAQAVSVVVFLLEKYGQAAFYRLSQEIRDGRPFEEALSRATGGGIASLADLERRWLTYAAGAI